MKRFRKRLILLAALVLPAVLMAAALRCAACGQTIRGRYIAADNGKIYCSESCWERTLPKCAVCGTPIRGKHFRKDGRYYCSKPCIEQTLPKCDLCRKPLIGKYQVSGMPGEPPVKLCMDCVGRARCFACLRPGAATVLSDGRAICSECAAERLTPEEEKALFAEIRTRLERLLGEEIPCKLKFYTLDEVRLKRRLPKALEHSENREFGFCLSRMEIYERNGRRTASGYDCTIFVLSDLPRKNFIDTVAHELAHHWQYHRYPFLRKSPLSLAEGFAEYAASRINLIYRQPEMNRRKENNPDPVYGGGYREFRALAEKGGPRAVFEHLKRNSEP